jgi:hypothetical protein
VFKKMGLNYKKEKGTVQLLKSYRLCQEATTWQEEAAHKLSFQFSKTGMQMPCTRWPTGAKAEV